MQEGTLARSARYRRAANFLTAAQVYLQDSWYEDWGVRCFGFHGLSHAYCAERAATLLGRPLAQTKIVTCHLGSGCSLAAVDGGRWIGTTTHRRA